jgi:DNA-binding beta-propeller fold protein YncE
MRASGWLVPVARYAERRQSGRRDPAAHARAGACRRALGLPLACAVLALASVAGLGLSPNGARGDESPAEAESLAPTSAQTKEFLESGEAGELVEEPETNLHAAQTMPHRDLERGEALKLAEAVFEPELDSAGGIVGEIEPDQFLSNYAAVVPASSLPEEPGQSGEGLPTEHPNMPVLLESTIPLRTEDSSGKVETVDLELEHSEGELQPQNPLADVGIPEQLGEGISLVGPEVAVTVAGAPEGRAPTDVGGQFAFYPEIADNVDLIAAPTARGVETMVDIRSAEAPTETTYDVSLPAGAELEATKEGGAEVAEGGRATLLIPPPTAVDAAGNPVETQLTVSAESITVVTNPSPSTAYPILVDPTFIEEGWRWTLNHESMAAWVANSSNTSAFGAWPFERWASEWMYPGLDLTSGLGGNASVGTQANWEYVEPRYREDVADFGTAPKSWVYQLFTEGFLFLPYGSTANYPALVIGLTEPGKGWQTADVHYGGQGELNNWGNYLYLTNEKPNGEAQGDKGADMNIVTYEAEYPAKLRDTYMADAYVWVVDEEPPKITRLEGPQHWLNTTPEPITFEIEDLGLGVKWTPLSFEGHEIPGGFNLPCTGTTASPCPRRVRSSSGKPGEVQANLAAVPTSLPTGRDPVTLMVGDPMWSQGVAANTTSQTVVLKVDHTAPEVALSGSLTEEASIGTHRSSYALRIHATDGVEGAPQSGVKKVEVLVDGKKKVMPEEEEWEPNCQSQNCPFNGEWTMNASEYGAGPHEVKVIATDAANNPATKTLQVELHPTPPKLSVSGSLTEQASLGVERPNYNLKIESSALAESPSPASLPTYSTSFGGSGSGNGLFARPGGVALDPQGNLWVADSNNNRIEEFTEGGKFVAQIGPELAATECRLKRPTAIAASSGGDFWVTDSGEKRVVEISPAGKCLNHFGAAGEGGNGKFAGVGPEAIAIDYHGNIWVADTYYGRLEKFNENGIFIRSVSTKGPGAEQLRQPDGIAIGPGGDVFVTDWEDNKVAEWNEGGKFIRQFGSQGNEPGQLQQPSGIAIDSKGDVWVADQNNGRIEEFGQGGEYLGRFGAKGSGAGQFELSYPTGIATDAKGDIWVTDTGNNRVVKWTVPAYASITAWASELRTIGSMGTGQGQFRDAAGVAVDSKGDVWATDFEGGRVEEFSENGGVKTVFGSKGSGALQFEYPYGIAVDGKGRLWVVEMGNTHRVDEYNETGGLIRQFGGSGSGQLKEPIGIAIDGKNDVWVSDFGNNRVVEFSETGTVIRTIGGGTSGLLKEPHGIAVTPAGNVWVADSGNNRLSEFSETGSLIREVGAEGSGVGRFRGPTDVDVDTAGNLWVVDEFNHRVQELTAQGEFIGQFGSEGTGPGTFETAAAIALDGKGHAFVSDFTRSTIREWTPRRHSQISTEITVDGKRVEAFERGCEAESCGSTNEWTLQSSHLSSGSHEVVVRATDGLGDTTSKSLNIKVGDATKPSLEVSGELFEAPKGWIEQEEGNYGLHASAIDSGYGVTSVVFFLDGKEIVPKTQACPGGGCSAVISTTVNAHQLVAGAHVAEVVATDGAGNVSARKWTVNVDPEGAISTKEAEATFEALQTTAPVNLIGASKEEEEYEATAPGLAVESKNGALVGTGGNVPIAIGTESGSGMTLEVLGESAFREICLGLGEELEEMGPGGGGEEGLSPEPPCLPRVEAERLAKEEEEEVARGEKTVGREPITITPAGGPAEGSPALVEGVAAVSTNTGDAVDTVTRPLSDGGLDFQDIRSTLAPEHYAFEISSYSSELELRQVSPQVITAFYKDGGWSAFTLEAEPAHDADGNEVPTHLTLNGPLLVTLTVEHRGIAAETGEPFVYPVIGGTGWHGGWGSGKVEEYEPPPPSEPGDPQEETPGEELVVSAPERSTPQEAGITDPKMIAESLNSTSRYFARHIRCGVQSVPGDSGILNYGPGPFSCGNPFTREEGSDDAEYGFGVKGWFFVSPGHFVSHRGNPADHIECPKMDYPNHYHGGLAEPDWFIDPEERCVWWGATPGGGGSFEPMGKHLTAYGEWNTGSGHPGDWDISQVGTALYIYPTTSGYLVERKKTTCIEC